MDVNVHERFSHITLRHKVKEQLLVRKDMNVNVTIVHKRLSHITLVYKLKSRNRLRFHCFKAFLHLKVTVGSSNNEQNSYPNCPKKKHETVPSLLLRSYLYYSQ